MAEARTEAGDWSPADYVVLRLTIEEAIELEAVLEVEVRAQGFDPSESKDIHDALRDALAAAREQAQGGERDE